MTCIIPIWLSFINPSYGKCPRPAYVLQDVPAFVYCMTGPLSPDSPFQVGVNCGCKFDHDDSKCVSDGDLDLRDFARFQNSLVFP